MAQLFDKKNAIYYVLLNLVLLQIQLMPNCTLFDPLFPNTPFKNVIIACMKARSSAQIIMNHKGPDSDAEILLDSMLGRLTRLNSTVNIFLDNKNSYTAADIEYILSIIEYMNAEINHSISKHSDDRRTDITPLTISIKSRLESVLEQL